VCGGKGFIPDGTCEVCKGTGSVMQRNELSYSLPIGFIEGSVIDYQRMGHQDTDGAIGDVKLQFSYQLPEHWRRVSTGSLDLICDVFIKQHVLLSGANVTISAPNGETVKVKLIHGIIVNDVKSERLFIIFKFADFVEGYGRFGYCNFGVYFCCKGKHGFSVFSGS
jgi:DnaJ-class molecular chaperone